MIRKTKFIEILEDIRKRTDMRYGQILSNAPHMKLGEKNCDCGRSFVAEKKSDECKCWNIPAEGSIRSPSGTKT